MVTDDQYQAEVNNIYFTNTSKSLVIFLVILQNWDLERKWLSVYVSTKAKSVSWEA